MDEHLTEFEEEDVSEGQGDTDTDVPADTSTAFLRRQCNTHNRKYECRERDGQTGVLLDEGHLHIGVSSHLLDADHLIELIVVHCLNCLLIEIEILHTQRDDRIHLTTAADIVRKIGIVFTDEIFLQSPALLRSVIDSCLG